MDRIDAVLKNIQDSSTILRSSEDCTSPGYRKISAIFDMTEYLAQSPPSSPANSEPDSPRSSVSSYNDVSGFSRQISDPESSETESDQSDVFTENEVCSFVINETYFQSDIQLPAPIPYIVQSWISYMYVTPSHERERYRLVHYITSVFFLQWQNNSHNQDNQAYMDSSVRTQLQPPTHKQKMFERVGQD